MRNRNSEDESAKAHYVGQVAATYLGERSDEVKWNREHEVIGNIVATLPRGESVLDVPFGTGRFAELYAQAGLRAYGLDVSPDMLSVARSVVDLVDDGGASVELIRGDAERLPLAGGAVDNVVCVRLLNLIPLDVVDRIVAEFGRVAARRIVLQVRIVDRTVLGRARRAARAFRHQPSRVFGLLGRRLIRGRGKSVASSDSYSPENGFLPRTNHPLADVEAIFRRHGLTVARVVTVNESDTSLQFIGQPLRFYVLIPVQASLPVPASRSFDA